MNGESIELRTAEEREFWKAAILAQLRADGNASGATAMAAVIEYRLLTPAPALPGPRELEDALAKVCAPLSRYLPRGFPRPEHLASQVIDSWAARLRKEGSDVERLTLNADLDQPTVSRLIGARGTKLALNELIGRCQNLTFAARESAGLGHRPWSIYIDPGAWGVLKHTALDDSDQTMLAAMRTVLESVGIFPVTGYGAEARALGDDIRRTRDAIQLLAMTKGGE